MGGDCEQRCLDDPCSHIFSAWSLLSQSSVKVNNSRLCDYIWPISLAYFDSHMTMSDCEPEVLENDFNQDGFINFREFAGIALQFVGYNSYKAKQVNCSSCVGMEYYNV